MITTKDTAEMVYICAMLQQQGAVFEAKKEAGEWIITLIK